MKGDRVVAIFRQVLECSNFPAARSSRARSTKTSKSNTWPSMLPSGSENTRRPIQQSFMGYGSINSTHNTETQTTTQSIELTGATRCDPKKASSSSQRCHHLRAYFSKIGWLRRGKRGEWDGCTAEELKGAQEERRRWWLQGNLLFYPFHSLLAITLTAGVQALIGTSSRRSRPLI